MGRTQLHYIILQSQALGVARLEHIRFAVLERHGRLKRRVKS